MEMGAVSRSGRLAPQKFIPVGRATDNWVSGPQGRSGRGADGRNSVAARNQTLALQPADWLKYPGTWTTRCSA
jgi:hypothetical protein